MTMAVGFKEAAEPASASDVERLEQRIGRALPADYRAFLLRQDGGWVADNDQALKEIFAIGEDAPDWSNLWDMLELYNGRLPHWLLPVADDEYGNLFAISTRDSDFGSVWFWDHEEEADEGEPPSEENIEQRSTSWTDFLLGLQPVA